MSFFNELKRRNVFKVAASYAIVAWIVLQVADTTFPALNIPPWVISFITVLLLLGFPLALFIAWAFEMTPEGIKPTADVAVEDSIRTQTGQKMNYLVIAGLALLLVLVLVNKNLPDETPTTSSNVAVSDTVVAAPNFGVAESAAGSPTTPGAVAESAQLVPAIIPDSIAVLPFANVSPDPDDAYFAIGLHDEILNQLATIRNLRVISRQSVQRYADSDLSIPEIARELRVSTVMEGSVRYAGDRIRVTAQLIDAATDEHLWSQTYDLDFADVFAIESEIAMNVTNAMRVNFSVDERNQIAKIPTSSPEAYALYLNAISKIPGGEFTFTNDAILEEVLDLLDLAIGQDPEFARAYERKGTLHARLNQTELATEAFRKAASLDPETFDPDTIEAEVFVRTGRVAEAEPLIRSLLERRPDDERVLAAAREFHMRQGENAEALPYQLRIIDLYPDQQRSTRLSQIYSRLGQMENALIASERSFRMDPSNAAIQLEFGFNLATLGRQEEALPLLRTAELTSLGANYELGSPNGFSVVIYGYFLAGSDADARRLFEQFQKVEAEADLPTRARAYLSIGDNTGALELMQQMAEDKSTSNGVSFLTVAILRDNPHQLDVLNRPEFVEARSRL